MKFKLTCAFVMFGLLSAGAQGYGPQGHWMVGAVADERLRQADPASAAKIAALLDGLSLAEAALLPDEIKDWDKLPPGAQKKLTRLQTHPALLQQLRDFWDANHSMFEGELLHHKFHYTDVPVFGTATYMSGQTGRSRFDVVHMITYCAGVLSGEIPANNERRITKPVAVILLAHYVGDIHQPLHVGAEYFGPNRLPVNPDGGAQVFYADQGGNKLTLTLHGANGQTQFFERLHGYWDGDTVTAAMGMLWNQLQHSPAFHPPHPGPLSQSEIAAAVARGLGGTEPGGWQLPPQVGVKDWARAWADEMMPFARQAHQRLAFSHIQLNNHTRLAAGDSEEQTPAGQKPYRQWSGELVEGEIHRAGWRLAALLRAVVH